MARPRGIIDTRNPVEWKHPLNRGLVSWWLPFGPWRGGGTLRDLARRNDGTLTNFTLSSAWVPGRDGFGALSFDGSNDYVETGAISPSPQTLSFECWVRLSSTATEQTLLAITNGGATPSQYSQLLRFGSAAAVYCFDGASKLTASASLGTSAGVWYHVVGVWQNSGSQTVYVDGEQRATGAIGNLFTGWSPSPRVSFGVIATFGASAARFSGDFGSARFYNRALSASDIASLYDQTLRGHPDTLRRISSARWFVGTAGGGGGVEGTASGTVGVTCAASGSVGIAGTGAGTVGVTVAASGAVAVSGTAGGTVGVTCSAAGSPSVAGTGSGSVAVSVSATGTVAVSGTGAGTVGVSAAASGSVAVSGTAGGDVSVTLASAGTVAISGTASGTVNVTVSAQDSATTSGTASGTVNVTCSASGSVSITGTGAGEVGFTVASTAAVGITGTATGLVGITCAASDAVAPVGDTNIYVFTLF